MSMHHKAFVFRYREFSAELRPLLVSALDRGDRHALERFIDANVARARDPYDGTPLDARWRQRMEVGDVQELADFALTCFYDPSQDLGLGDAWQGAHAEHALGAALDGFDPGRQGSYFQTEADVSRHLSEVDAASSPKLTAMLRAAKSAGAGLYVTF